ncbi:Lipopolysaccharide kinase (Kdo/WaaP) family protein [compost metagenome]
MGLRSRAYLVTEYVDGPDLAECFAPYVDNGDAPEEQVDALVHVMQQLIRERISHGDFKGHNLFWHNGQWSLIDLDAMCQHATQLSFAPAYARDRARLLRNWPSGSALHQRLDRLLPKLAE